MQYTKDQDKIISRLLGNAKGRAKDPQKSRGKTEFNLTKEWIKSQLESQGFKCPYTNVPYYFGIGKSWHGRSGAPERPSINRLNPLQGYTLDNVELTSNFYNTQLSSWTHRETYKLVVGLAWFHIKKKLRKIFW